MTTFIGGLAPRLGTFHRRTLMRLDSMQDVATVVGIVAALLCSSAVSAQTNAPPPSGQDKATGTGGSGPACFENRNSFTLYNSVRHVSGTHQFVLEPNG